MGWTRIIPAERCPQGKGVFVEVGGKELAIFRLDAVDRFAVMDNTCPHAGGNLAGGTLEGDAVSCPWHHWCFKLDSGVCTHSSQARVRVYPNRVLDGMLIAELSESPGASCDAG